MKRYNIKYKGFYFELVLYQALFDLYIVHHNGIKEYITTIDYSMNIRKEMDKYIQSKKGAY